MAGIVFSTVRITKEPGKSCVVTDTITGETISNITSLEIFETAAHTMVAVIKRVVLVSEMDVSAAADICTEEVK